MKGLVRRYYQLTKMPSITRPMSKRSRRRKIDSSSIRILLMLFCRRRKQYYYSRFIVRKLLNFGFNQQLINLPPPSSLPHHNVVGLCSLSEEEKKLLSEELKLDCKKNHLTFVDFNQSFPLPPSSSLCSKHVRGGEEIIIRGIKITTYSSVGG